MRLVVGRACRRSRRRAGVNARRHLHQERGAPTRNRGCVTALLVEIGHRRDARDASLGIRRDWPGPSGYWGSVGHIACCAVFRPRGCRMHSRVRIRIRIHGGAGNTVRHRCPTIGRVKSTCASKWNRCDRPRAGQADMRFLTRSSVGQQFAGNARADVADVPGRKVREGAENDVLAIVSASMRQQ